MMPVATLLLVRGTTCWRMNFTPCTADSAWICRARAASERVVSSTSTLAAGSRESTVKPSLRAAAAMGPICPPSKTSTRYTFGRTRRRGRVARARRRPVSPGATREVCGRCPIQRTNGRAAIFGRALRRAQTTYVKLPRGSRMRAPICSSAASQRSLIGPRNCTR